MSDCNLKLTLFLHIFCRRLGLGVHLKLRSREEGGGGDIDLKF